LTALFKKFTITDGRTHVHTQTQRLRLCLPTEKISYRQLGPLHGSSSPFGALSWQWLTPIKYEGHPKNKQATWQQYFYILYISETYILHWPIWVCCSYDVIV